MPEPVEGRFDELSAHSDFAAQPVCLISPEQSAYRPFDPANRTHLGRDINRHPFAREAVDRLRSAHVDVLVVDMGWPSTTAGTPTGHVRASRLMGRALLSWLN